jgi:hypothetical protein
MQIKIKLRFHFIKNREKNQQILLRMWGGKRNPHILLIRIWISSSTISVEAPQKPKNRTTIGSRYTALKIYTLRNQNQHHRDNCIPMFHWRTIHKAKLWNQPRCILTDEWIKKMWYTYTMGFYLAIKSCHLQKNRWNWRSSY